MSIDALQSRSTTPIDTESTTPNDNAPIAHSTPVVTHPEIAALSSRVMLSPAAFVPRVTLATITADVGRVEHQLARVESDLKSTQLRDAVRSDAKLYEAYVKANITAAGIFSMLYMFKERGLQFSVILGLLSKVVDLSKTLQPFQDLTTANRAAINANRAAHPALVQLGHDLADLLESAQHLAGDATKLAAGL